MDMQAAQDEYISTYYVVYILLFCILYRLYYLVVDLPAPQGSRMYVIVLLPYVAQVICPLSSCLCD